MSNHQNAKPVIITIKRLGINGEGLGYYQKKIIFIPGALPGEVVVARITKRRSHYLEGELVRIKEKSPDRLPFPKGVNPKVGGLELACLPYEKQLLFKQQMVQEALARFKPEHWRHIKVQATLPAPHSWHYRNKAQYQVAFEHGRVMAGLYEPHSHHVVDLPVMPTQSETSQKIELAVKKLLAKFRLPIADSRRKLPGVKTVVVRSSYTTGQSQLTLITVGEQVRGLDRLVAAAQKIRSVTGIFQNITQWDNPQVWGNKTVKLWGADYIQEKIDGKTFNLSPRAFFQLNSEQTVNLYHTALQMLDLQPSQTLVDAYSGVGTLGILAADQVKQVIGLESIPDAVHDAQLNCRQNGVHNAQYIQGAAEEKLGSLAFDALIVDPPRTGLAKQMIKAILAAQPQTFVYISCNPSTLAQDLVLLSEKYKVRVIKSVDMLPQTPRCEAVAKLVLK
ncbi:MAG: 23S rRNA (uracil(1939)-C(5))-methyltransferase RlmD [Lactobacillus sp.]